MKLKTMLRFLLCFLIIGSGAFISISYARTCPNGGEIYQSGSGYFCLCNDTGYEVIIEEGEGEGGEDIIYHQAALNNETCSGSITKNGGNFLCSECGIIVSVDLMDYCWVHDNKNLTGEKCPVSKCTGTISIKYGEKYCNQAKNYIESFDYYGVETWQHARYSKCHSCSYESLLAKKDGKYYCPKTNLWVEFKEYKYVHTNKSTLPCEAQKEVTVVGDNMKCGCGFYVETGAYNWWHIDCETCGSKLSADNKTCEASGKNVVKKKGKYVHSDVVEVAETEFKGISASYFFNAPNKTGDGWDILYEWREVDDPVGTGKDVVNQNLQPVLHIQSLIMMVGVIIAVIVSLIYGIQWAMATPAKRQELKAGMWPLIIGIGLLVIGPALATKIYSLVEAGSTGVAGDYVRDTGSIIINVIQSIGYIVAVIMVLVIGIQWIVAVPSKRQELKSRLINLIIGAFIIVGSMSILGLIYDAVKSINI